MILISGCATEFVGVVENKPTIYPSEAAVLPFPIKPSEGDRTNANMHNYRKQLEEWGCDTIILFSSFVERVTEDQSVSVPAECESIVTGDRKYLFLK